MMSTVVVRGGGGALFEVDAPTAGQALSQWNEKLAKGDLMIVEDKVEWVDAGEGAKKLVVVDRSEATPSKPEPKPKPSPKAKAGTDVEE
jgi:hypothetical protein